MSGELAPELTPLTPTLSQGERELGDRINPIVIKEVRQGLRTKVFWICFSLMLLACLVISLIAFAVTRDAGTQTVGQEFFFSYFVCLGVVHFFVIPYSAHRSLAKEREEETWVLLTLTGLGPRRILRGKLVSYLVQAALYGSAAGPFLVFSYYLNGIDLPTILAVLLLGAAYLVFLTAASVSAATLAEHKVMRALAHFLLLGVLLGGTSMGLGIAFALTEEGHSIVNDKDFQLAIGIGLWAMLSYGLLLFEAAAARLSLPTESYAKGPRLAFLFQLLATAGLLFYLWLREGQEPGVAVAGQIFFCLHLTVVGLFLTSDVDGQAPCHRDGTGPFSLLRPGALRGFRLVMVALLASSLFFLVLFLFSEEASWMTSDLSLQVLLAAGAYVALYLSMPLVLTRLSTSPRWRQPLVTRVVFLAVLLVGAGVPPLVGAIAFGKPEEPSLNLFNPVVGLVNLVDRRQDDFGALLLLWAVAAAAVIAADRLLAARDIAPSPSGRGQG
ncbi:MAG: ABC transporter permease [Myxococcota bacterium]